MVDDDSATSEIASGSSTTRLDDPPPRWDIRDVRGLVADRAHARTCEDRHPTPARGDRDGGLVAGRLARALAEIG